MNTALEDSRARLVEMCVGTSQSANGRAKSRISIFLPSLQGGGAERVALNLAEGFSRRGYQVDLVLARKDGPLVTEVPPLVRLVDLGASRTIMSLPRLAMYLRRERPLAIISGLDHGNPVVIGAAALSGTGTRVLITSHYPLSRSIAAGNRPAKTLARIAQHCYHRADSLVAVSEGVAADVAVILRRRKPRVHVIYNPVITPGLLEKATFPVEHPYFADPAARVAVAAGRLTADKDFKTLIRAFAVARSLVPLPFRMVILGEGEERPALEAMVRDLGLAAQVSLPGFTLNPYPTIARASLFVLSSRWEALPTVLIEALALGTRVLATDCSGAREILQNGKLGMLCPVKDAEALGRGIAAGIMRADMGAALETQVVESLTRFSLKEAVDSYERLILEPRT